jgi:hypothetical protein
MFSSDPWIWVQALLTLGMLSLLYRENSFFRIAEQIYVGSTIGHLMVIGWESALTIGFKPLLEGKWVLIFPLLGGFLLYSRWYKPLSYLSRIPMGFISGTLAAVFIPAAIKTSFINQIVATMLPLNSFNNIVFVICCVTATFYFLFTVKAKWGQPVIQTGRYTMMVAFGAAFGFTVMGRISLFIGRMQLLLGEWIKLIR